jgi:hypothetical protein
MAWMRIRALSARRAVLGLPGEQAKMRAPYILYFSGEACSVCRTHQEPALRALDGVRIEKIDALAEADLARRYHVYTLPTTVVVDADGRPRHVNYGYASAEQLRGQIDNE